MDNTRYHETKDKLLSVVKERAIKTIREGTPNWKVRELARRLRCKQGEVVSITEDLNMMGEQIEVLVGIRCGGMVGEFEHIGDYEVSYYGDE